MATRAERFRAAVERSGKKRQKRPPAPKPSYQVDTSLPGTSASDRRHGGKSTASRNRSLAHRATYALEDSVAPKPPSRKSTRRSKNRQKAAVELKGRVALEASAPRRRHLVKT